MRPTARLYQVIAPEVVARQLQVLNRESRKQVWAYTTSGTETESQSLLQAAFQFRSFATTWRFLNYVALAASKQRHHPTIETTYNTVRMTITTHDVGNKVTNKDLRLLEAVHNAYRYVEAPQSTQKLEDLLLDLRSDDPLHQASRIIDEMVKTR